MGRGRSLAQRPRSRHPLEDPVAWRSAHPLPGSGRPARRLGHPAQHSVAPARSSEAAGGRRHHCSASRRRLGPPLPVPCSSGRARLPSVRASFRVHARVNRCHASWRALMWQVCYAGSAAQAAPAPFGGSQPAFGALQTAFSGAKPAAALGGMPSGGLPPGGFAFQAGAAPAQLGFGNAQMAQPAGFNGAAAAPAGGFAIGSGDPAARRRLKVRKPGRK